MYNSVFISNSSDHGTKTFIFLGYIFHKVCIANFERNLLGHGLTKRGILKMWRLHDADKTIYCYENYILLEWPQLCA